MPYEHANFILQDGTSEVRQVESHLNTVEVLYTYGGDCIFDEGPGPLLAKVTFRPVGILGENGFPEYRATGPAPIWVSLIIRRNMLRQELEGIEERLHQAAKRAGFLRR